MSMMNLEKLYTGNNVASAEQLDSKIHVFHGSMNFHKKTN
jgi:hypothetical protein